MTAAPNLVYAYFLGTISGFRVAGFLGSIGFADFDVGSVCAECYRSDVAINLTSGGFCRFNTKGGDKQGCEITRVVNPDGSWTTEFEMQGEKYVGTIQEDQRANPHR